MFQRLLQLPDDFTVIANAGWLSRTAPSGVPRDGEADFIVAHPNYGLLVLEVKGGRIAHDPKSKDWTSTDRDDETYQINDPFEQAKKSKYALLNKLKEQPGWNNRWIPAGHVVIFPDGEVVPLTGNPAIPPAFAPKEVLLTSKDVATLPAQIVSAFKFWQGQEKGNGKGFGHDGVELLVKICAPSLKVEPVPLGTVANDNRTLLELTESQFRVLNQLRRARRVHIIGAAGTGKTVLAAEQARRLAGEGFRTLLTCYNRPLGDHLQRNKPPGSGLVVATFHQVCMGLAGEVEAQSLPENPTNADWDIRLPEAILAARTRIKSRYDAIIVDEGQDFSARWWRVIDALLEPDGLLYVFSDENQALYPGSFVPTDLFPVVLTENCRNTAAIHKFSAPWYRGEPIKVLGPEGRPVDRHVIARPADTGLIVDRVVNDLMRTEQLRAEDIAVLVSAEGKNSLLAKRGAVASCRVSHDASSSDLLVTTVFSFKGLERTAVILAELDSVPDPQLAAVLYVGATRARSSLSLVATRNTFMRAGLGRGLPH